MLDWLRSGLVRVRPILGEPAPEHWGLVRPVVAPEPAPQGSGSRSLVRVRTWVHLGSGIKYIYFNIIYVYKVANDLNITQEQ